MNASLRSLKIFGFATLIVGLGWDATPDPTEPVTERPVQSSRLNPDVAGTVELVLESAEHPGHRWSAIPDVVTALKPLYESEPDRLLWFDGDTPESGLAAVLATISAVREHGLDPEDYDAALLAEQWRDVEAGKTSAPERAHFDLAISIAVVRVLEAVHVGRVDPATMHWGYDVEPKRIDRGAELRKMQQGLTLAAAIDALEPQLDHYARAKTTLGLYRELARAGEPPSLPELPEGRGKIDPNTSWSGVPRLVERLRVLGDLTRSAALPSEPDSYAGPIVDAVKRFQHRHALEEDGIIGANTLEALNVSLADRIRQIELAMERMRWLPTLGDRPNVFVNVPLFRLWATDPTTGEEPLRMNVVVGKSLNHRTPIFVEEMEYVVFRPYWNPPRAITVRELIPHVRRDPAYFDRANLQIVATGADDAASLPPTEENLAAVVAGKLYLRQKPGPANSLGLAKFIFPNASSVYMHGTPAQSLFSRARRDFSHGCIRLEDPAAFGQWVLRNAPGWTRERIDTAMQAERPTRVNLEEHLTVVLFYDTVHVDHEGVLFFVDDLYGHDAALDAALGHGYPYPAS